MENFRDYFEEGDVVAINNTKVFQLVYANKEKTGAKIEVSASSLIKKIGYGTF